MYKAPRGTFDIFGADARLRDDVVASMFATVKMFCFEPITTPIFESEDLFCRAVGESSDIVSKEIYSFTDKKERSLALRPELTAPIMRSYLEHKMGAQDPVRRFAYYGPSFRYERPQAGRYRQFYQFGVESMGIKSPVYDSQIIAMACTILNQLGIKNYRVRINCLGSLTDRQKYNEALAKYFSDVSDLCSDCQMRIKKNPLRILDCKIDGSKDMVKNAPPLSDYLSEESKHYFELVKGALTSAGIEFEVDSSLVRGLDYYNDIVFEIVADNDNAQNTLIGGGRYDQLATDLGSKTQVDSIGFAIGVERIIEELKRQYPNILDEYPQELDIYFHFDNEEQRANHLDLLNKLRDGLIVDANFGEKSYKSSLKHALKHEAVFLITPQEDKLLLRNLKTKEERELTKEELIWELEHR